MASIGKMTVVYVNNIWDLAKHVAHHRARVYRLGITLDGSLLSRVVLRVHDLEKYLFLPWLWKYYGGKGDRRIAKRLYTRMNTVGRAILWVATLPFSGASIAEAQKSEKIADIVDRQCDPVAVEEFQRILPMSKFLNDHELEVAEILKPRYREIVKELYVPERFVSR